MVFKMAVRGTYFAAPEMSRDLFEELAQEEIGVPRDEELIIDLAGVTHISNSVARRFINRLLLERAGEGRPARYIHACSEVEETIRWARERGERPSRELLSA